MNDPCQSKEKNKMVAIGGPFRTTEANQEHRRRFSRQEVSKNPTQEYDRECL